MLVIHVNMVHIKIYMADVLHNNCLTSNYCHLKILHHETVCFLLFTNMRQTLCPLVEFNHTSQIIQTPNPNVKSY